jgi:hypothetical protein
VIYTWRSQVFCRKRVFLKLIRVFLKLINVLLVILLLTSCTRPSQTTPTPNGLLSGSALAQVVKLAQSDTSSKRASVALSKMGLSLQWDKAIAIRQLDWETPDADALERPSKAKQQTRDTLMVSTKGERYQLVYYYQSYRPVTSPELNQTHLAHFPLTKKALRRAKSPCGGSILSQALSISEKIVMHNHNYGVQFGYHVGYRKTRVG